MIIILSLYYSRYLGMETTSDLEALRTCLTEGNEQVLRTCRSLSRLSKLLEVKYQDLGLRIQYLQKDNTKDQGEVVNKTTKMSNCKNDDDLLDKENRINIQSS